MKRRNVSMWWMLALAGALVACSEKPQTAVGSKSDQPAWQGAQDPYVVSGWKPGDKASWQEQLKHRATMQNEYNRTQ